MWYYPPPSNHGHSCLICLPPSRFPPPSSYLPPPAAKAPEGAYYIVAVSGGTVLSNQAGGIRSQNAVNSDIQRWRVEYGDISHENHVAIRNVSDGKWLRALTDDACGEVVTADERQWWTIEEGPSPGSCWLKCNDFEDAYLCIANGSHLDDNAVYTTAKQSENAHAFTWNLRDADVVGYDAKGWRLNHAEGGLDVEEGGRLRREIAELERALDDRQSVLLEKERSLAAQEFALKKQFFELAAKEADIQRKAQILNNSSNTDIALLRTEDDNLHLQLRTSSLEREVEKVKDRAVSSNITEQLRNLENETARLKTIVNSHERSARSSPSPTKFRDMTPVFNSPSPNTARSIRHSNSPLIDQDSFSLRSPPEHMPIRGSRVPSLAATPASPRRPLSRDTPSTPTRPSTTAPSLASETPKSYDSRFSGWQEDERAAPITPNKELKRANSSAISSEHSRRDPKTPLSTKRKTPSPASMGPGSANGAASPTGLGISTRPHGHVSPMNGRLTNKGTSAKSELLHATTPSHKVSPGTSLTSDDGDAVIHPCGHKIYKPPRKLNKTVAGYLYE
ncbi:hypothetical protein Q7P37_005850 [Cladosporium fusiforme]